MAIHVDDDLRSDQTPPPSGPPSDGSPPPRRRGRTILLIVGGLLVLVALAVAAWFLFGRSPARQLDDGEALAEFRAAGGSSSTAEGLPAAGVYAATATGSESIGLPGFDEDLGPNAPVTVTHGDGGCFDYRADFNSHHWRSWTFCPSETALFALARVESWTARKAPGLDIETLSTYECASPADVLWQGATVGESRSGSCTGTTDMDDSVTDDAMDVEVLGTDESLTVGGESIGVVRIRTSESFSNAQTGREVDEWWLDATTGLPLRIDIDSQLAGGPSDYAETARLELTSTTPAT